MHLFAGHVLIHIHDNTAARYPNLMGRKVVTVPYTAANTAGHRTAKWEAPR